MAAASEKQVAYLASLKTKFAQTNTPKLIGEKARGAQCLQQIAFLRALPTPATSTEASEQIQALSGTTLNAYAQAHRAWAEGVIATITAHVADPMAIPTSDNGGEWSTKAWIAYVEQTLR